eukprot:TRINITY_DN125989_c0_g1_i1.p1 TRINITY_DN125989_c0_g1~~TRINITY_DN125989_c0_g1_i1.p1  ORF type:complete len:126 (+),score=2.09 TRINITY_DN125989_c0_g1_i1:329-706(+)
MPHLTFVLCASVGASWIASVVLQESLRTHAMDQACKELNLGVTVSASGIAQTAQCKVSQLCNCLCVAPQSLVHSKLQLRFRGCIAVDRTLRAPTDDSASASRIHDRTNQRARGAGTGRQVECYRE